MIEVARSLFVSLGYKKTTLARIADEVGVNVRTIQRHFPSKQHLALAYEWEKIDRFKLLMSNNPNNLSVLNRWCYFVQDELSRETRDARAYYRELANDPELSAHLLKIMNENGKILADYLLLESGAKDLNTNLRVRLIARLISEGTMEILRWSWEQKERDDREIYLRLMNELISKIESIYGKFDSVKIDMSNLQSTD